MVFILGKPKKLRIAELRRDKTTEMSSRQQQTPAYKNLFFKLEL